MIQFAVEQDGWDFCSVISFFDVLFSKRTQKLSTQFDFNVCDGNDVKKYKCLYTMILVIHKQGFVIKSKRLLDHNRKDLPRELHLT